MLHSINRYLCRSFSSTPALLANAKVLASLSAKNFFGETPLIHAARAPEPGAFVAVADMLPADKVWDENGAKRCPELIVYVCNAQGTGGRSCKEVAGHTLSASEETKPVQDLSDKTGSAR